MTASEIAFLIGALCGSLCTWIVCSNLAMDARLWRHRCDDWKHRYTALKRERTSGDEWKDNDHERN